LKEPNDSWRRYESFVTLAISFLEIDRFLSLVLSKNPKGFANHFNLASFEVIPSHPAVVKSRLYLSRDSLERYGIVG
jgi:hypothetical protein